MQMDLVKRFPEPPLPALLVECRKENIPQESGVYFLWVDGRIVYVGKSVNLRDRVKSTSHKHTRLDDGLSWILAESGDLSSFEAFYISVLQPERNVQGNGSNKSESEHSDWMNPPRIARRLGVSKRKVLGWIHSGQLQAVNVAENLGGRPRWRISAASLHNFLNARANRKSQAPQRRRRLPATVHEFFK